MKKTDCAPTVSQSANPLRPAAGVPPGSVWHGRPRAKNRCVLLVALCIATVLAAGCGSPRKSTTVAGAPHGKGGGYYKDDGPGRNIPANIEKIPDAVPRIERHNPANFKPYTVLGQRFVPVSATTPLQQKGVASWYGRKFHGQKTANGETYDMYAMTAAHPTLPLPSYARVTHAASGRSVIVRVNDRGPFLRGRVIDLSYAAAAKLGIIGQGSDVVMVEAITHADIRKGLNMAAAQNTPATVTATPVRPVQTAQPSRPAQAVPVQVAAAPAAPAPNVESSNTPASNQPVTPDALAVLNPQALGTADDSRAPAPTITDEAATDGVYLQFGAFGSYLSADRLVNQLNTEIAHVESRNAHIKSRDDLHRVRIGPYPTRTAAVNAAVRIQEATGMQPTLAQR